MCYLDDLIISSSSFEEHWQNIDSVFTRIRESNLKLGGDKYQFFRQRLLFLVVSSAGIKMGPDKIAKVRDWLAPSTAKS